MAYLWPLGGGCGLSGEFRPVRYFLLLSKCAVHQVALSAKNGVIGRAAATAAVCDGAKVFQNVVGTAVRIFKYLVPQYYEDFKKSVDE